jgi:hypothetical protein
MYKSVALGMCVFATTLLAVDPMGTWKLNTAKSKYTGTPGPKEMTVTYSPEGSGWRYAGSGVSAAGTPIKSNFVYVKDGAEIKTTGFPNWEGLVLNDAKSDKATGVIMRGGKPIGKLSRTFSADGKTMMIHGEYTGLDGKPATYHSVYDRQ